MALTRGYKAVDDAAKAFKEQQAQRDAQRVPDVFLQNDGDRVTFFLNGEDEPVCADVHVLKTKWPNGRDRYVDIFCTADTDEGCVACHSRDAGDKRVAPPVPTFYWSVVDTRFVHKKLDKEKTAKAGGRFDKFEYISCKSVKKDPNPKICPECREGVEREMRGVSKFKQRATLAGVMKRLHEDAAGICAGCGNPGEVVDYQKGKKHIDSVIGREDAEEWTTNYSCESCKEFTPTSLRDCPITMVRTGKGKGTTYTLTAGKSMVVPDYIADIAPVNLDEVLVPVSADAQAKLLSIRNPFKKGGKTTEAYDDDNETEVPDSDPTNGAEIAETDDLFS